MRADEILTMGEAALLENPASPEEAVRAIQRFVLSQTIEEMGRKVTAYQRTIDRLSKKLSEIIAEERQTKVDF